MFNNKRLVAIPPTIEMAGFLAKLIMIIEIHKTYLEETGDSLLDTWNVSDNYPIPNVGDYVQGKDCWNEQIRWRTFDGKIVKLYV